MGPGHRATTLASRVASSEAPTRCASTGARVAVSSDTPPSQPVVGTEGSSTGASITKKRGRGPSRGKNAERLRASHGPLEVLILDGVGVPVGVNSAKVMAEIGFLARTFASIRNVHKWKKISAEEKAPLIARLLTKFNIRDYHEKVGVRKSIDKKLAARYRDHRFHMHAYYKDLVDSGVDPKSKPYGDVIQEDWEYIIDTLYKDPKFQRNLATNEPPHIVDFFHDSHVNKKGANERIGCTKLEKGVEPLTQDEIACTVLGSRPGYKKGFGYGPKPLSSSELVIASVEYQQQADMIKELQATVESLKKKCDETKRKLEKIEDAQQTMQQEFADAQQTMQQKFEDS